MAIPPPMEAEAEGGERQEGAEQDGAGRGGGPTTTKRGAESTPEKGQTEDSRSGGPTTTREAESTPGAGEIEVASCGDRGRRFVPGLAIAHRCECLSLIFFYPFLFSVTVVVVKS